MTFINLLIALFIPSAYAADSSFCDVSTGLNLINKSAYSASQIETLLNSCDKIEPNSAQVLLLHGLFERNNKHYNLAVQWLEKARTVAPQNQVILMELATTYEWNKQLPQAEQIYQQLLTQSSQNRNAQLGLARVLRMQGKYVNAQIIYQNLLKQDGHDVDALNGLGWINTAEKKLTVAQQYFNEVLTIQPQNTEALSALDSIKQTQLQTLSSDDCDINQGLILLNATPPAFSQISSILNRCNVHHIENKNTYLLHGLLARKEAEKDKHYSIAIDWFKKALKASPANDDRTAMELAITYEWANQSVAALRIYQNLLDVNKENRNALLGKARVLRTLKQWVRAQDIYRQLLQKNNKDADAFNGLGWIQLANKHFKEATDYFKESLMAQQGNLEALTGLNSVNFVEKSRLAPVKTPILCDADEGLRLLNKENPPVAAIEGILARCDKNTPNATSPLLLHGLLARYFGKKTQTYSAAIPWLEKAALSAAPDNYIPELELAVTYEWMNSFTDALFIYNQILKINPTNTHALLGKARTLRFSYQIQPAFVIYAKLLKKSPNNVMVLNGLGETYLVNYQFKEARSNFNKVLTLDPKNKDATQNLELLENATQNILEVTLGHYVVPPNDSDGLNLYYFRNLNATDSLSLLAVHNTKQIQSGFGTGSALLPNNSLLLGYQRAIPNEYGWQVSYDGRQHNSLPFENRLYGAGSLYLHRNLEWFGGVRLAFPDQWNTQLLMSGFTAYTPLPVNFTFTGFWAFQEIGGYNSSYSLDLSKEYNNHLFYSFGPSYLVEQQSWEAHGRLILPIFKNQAIVLQGSHYIFNKSTFATASWRIYWA